MDGEAVRIANWNDLSSTVSQYGEDGQYGRDSQSAWSGRPFSQSNRNSKSAWSGQPEWSEMTRIASRNDLSSLVSQGSQAGQSVSMVGTVSQSSRNDLSSLVSLVTVRQHGMVSQSSRDSKSDQNS